MSDTSQKVPTPELDKMLAVKEFSQKCGDFLSWMQNEKSIELAKYKEVDECEYCGGDFEGELLVPFHSRTEDLLAEFFGIDLKKCEEERQAILASLNSK